MVVVTGRGNFFLNEVLSANGWWPPTIWKDWNTICHIHSFITTGLDGPGPADVPLGQIVGRWPEKETGTAQT